MTPREVVWVLEGQAKRQAREFDERRALNHHLAGLVAFAHHDPTNMPEFKPLAAALDPKAREREAEIQAIRERGDLIRATLRARARAGPG